VPRVQPYRRDQRLDRQRIRSDRQKRNAHRFQYTDYPGGGVSLAKRPRQK
jgi:hypothetical protein